MIYAAFSAYLLGIFFAGLGIYRLWAGMVKPRWVSWALLPGTVVSEMAYIFGSLITGGEVRRAKLMSEGEAPAGRRSKGRPEGQSEPTTETSPRFPFFGPVVASFACILACGAGIVVAHALLGGPVIGQFVRDGGMLPEASLPQSLPTSTAAFWEQVDTHVRLLRRMSATWLRVDWLNWRVPLFVYLTICLSIRLAPVRRSLRATLVAVVALAAAIALLGVAWSGFEGLMKDERAGLWPLVTYIWSMLMFLLCVTLIIRAAFGLIRALGESDGKSPARKGE